MVRDFNFDFVLCEPEHSKANFFLAHKKRVTVILVFEIDESFNESRFS